MSLLPQQKNRMGIRRQLAPLHQGFGFGAKEIQEESLRIARVATEEKRQKLDQALDLPLPGSGVGSTLPRFGGRQSPGGSGWTLPFTRAVEADASSARAASEFSSARSALESSAVQGGALDARAVPGSVPALTVADHQVLASRLLADAPESEVVEVGPGAALIACFFDTVIALSCTVFVGGMNYSLSSTQAMESFASRLAEVLPFLAKAQMPLFAFGLQVYIGAVFVTFALQAAFALACGASAGRFAVGISLAEPAGKSLGGRVAIALHEAISLGGLLTVPLQILSPARLPLFPFVRLKRVSQA